ncbi:MAG: transglycosylase family protein [Solirubrobacteraceae bacterium]
MSRRRRSLRSRGSAVTAAIGLLLLSATALAGGTGGAIAGKDSSEGSSKSTISQVQEKLGLKADGIAGRKTRRAIRRFQRRNDLRVDGRIGPETLSELGIDADRRRASSASLDDRLEGIAECESDGDPRAVSRGGRYFGKYQFSRRTWRSVGGRGNPARASEAEQDRRAAALLARDGTDPWPNCA